MRKRKKLFIIFIIIIVVTTLILLLSFMFPHIEFKLNGSNNIILKYKEEYKEEGVIAKVNFLFDFSNKVNIDSSNLNFDKIGKYDIYYTFKWLFGKKITLTRNVEIVDNIAPTIELKGENPLSIAYGSNYSEPGYNVTDNYNNNEEIKVNITYNKTIDTKQSGSYVITYEAIDSSDNKSSITRTVTVRERPKIYTENGMTYVDGVLIVNKKYSLPSSYNPGVNNEAYNSLKMMQNDASKLGYSLYLCSGFRSYWDQKYIYNDYVSKYGQTLTDTFSARPGHSEHQTGLAFDVGAINDDFGNWPNGAWLAENAHKYGFIIRYPKGKQHITGYKYEPWHIRYLGVDLATKVYNSGLTLEEYLGI